MREPQGVFWGQSGASWGVVRGVAMAEAWRGGSCCVPAREGSRRGLGLNREWGGMDAGVGLDSSEGPGSSCPLPKAVSWQDPSSRLTLSGAWRSMGPLRQD